MLHFLQSVLLAVLTASPAPSASPAPTAPPAPTVHVFSCQSMSGEPNVPLSDMVGLVVRFQNDSLDPLTSIVWRAKYGTHLVDFIDDGTFSPATRIDNWVLFERGSTRFDWGGAAGNIASLFAHTPPTHSMARADMVLPPYIGSEDPENCSIVRATWASGDQWFNPALTQTAAVLPTATPKPTPLPDGVPTPTPTATPAPSASEPPIEIQHCTLALGGRPNLSVTYFSGADKNADTIIFRAPYATSALDFTDLGTFAPNTLITHNLKIATPDALKARSFLSFDEPEACAVVSVHFADGTTWQNPLASASPAPLPTAVPDALSGTATTPRWSQKHAMPTPQPTTDASATASPVPSP